jgi:hypothetical protein
MSEPKVAKVGEETSMLRGFEQSRQHIHSNDKEQRRDGVALPQATTMEERVTSVAVDQDTRGRCSEDESYSLGPARPKTSLPEHAQEERPGKTVKSLRHVNLEEKRGDLLPVEKPRRFLDQQEVVLDAPIPNKRRLIRAHQVQHTGGQTTRQHLRE